MKKKQNITWFDLETTGLNINTVGIVSIYAINYKLKREIDTLINPEIDIPKEASEVHGIYKKHIKNKPIFKDISTSVKETFSLSEYIGGYNICRYDVPLLISLYQRNNIDFDIKNIKFVDVFYIIKNVIDEEDLNNIPTRSLENVYKLITGKTLDAHKAKYDVLACVEILDEMEKFGLPWRDYILTYEDLRGSTISNPNFKMKTGKHTGKTIDELIKNENRYLKWMTNNNRLILSPELTKLIK